jgi:hypothetical protein
MVQGRTGGFFLSHGGQTSMLDLVHVVRRAPEPTGFPTLDLFLQRAGREVGVFAGRLTISEFVNGGMYLEGAT